MIVNIAQVERFHQLLEQVQVIHVNHVVLEHMLQMLDLPLAQIVQLDISLLTLELLLFPLVTSVQLEHILVLLVQELFPIVLNVLREVFQMLKVLHQFLLVNFVHLAVSQLLVVPVAHHVHLEHFHPPWELIHQLLA
jgi:hypothetical protein